MAYKSDLKDGSDLNKVEIPEACRNGSELSLYVNYGDGDGDKGLRTLFDQVLSIFLKEVSLNKNAFRPFPPKLGDGLEVDLFKLFLTVRRIGGYELVSQNELWEFVANECGMEIGNVASLKLVYDKYLKELDQWLHKGGFKDEKLENIEIGVIQKLDLLSCQLHEYTCSSSNQIGKIFCDRHIVGSKDGNEGSCDGGMLGEKRNEATLGFNQNEDGMNPKTSVSLSTISGDDKKLLVVDGKSGELSQKNVVKKVGFLMINDDNRRSELSPDNVVKKVGLSVINDDDKRSELSLKSVVKEVETSMASDEGGEFRVEEDKRVSLAIKNVVDEVLRFHSDNDAIAKDDDEKVEKVIISDKRESDGVRVLLSELVDWVADSARDSHAAAIQGSSQGKNNKLMEQALLARRALFAELNVDSGNKALCSSQKKNQKMHPGMYEDDRVEVHQASEKKRGSGRATCAKPCSCPGCISSRPKRQRTESAKTPADETTDYDKCKVGSRHQVEVPEWTGKASESDSKWLGTRMWPPPDEKPETETLAVGLGRQSSCECLFPGCVECVRFHIAEKRLKLRVELGPVFYLWKFNKMGEEAALSWHPDEEKRFRGLVVKARQDLEYINNSRHEIMRKFWRGAAASLPAKPKQQLVSYYFNVYVLRRRSYQNRVTPRKIDSDNDEEEVGSVGDSFGYEKVHGLLPKCAENMQCTDLKL